MSEQNYHWETSKENVLPLKQGRTVAAIEETFQQNSSKGKINNEKTEREKRYFYARSVVYSSRVSLSFARFVLGKKRLQPKERLILKNTDLFSLRRRTKLQGALERDCELRRRRPVGSLVEVRLSFLFSLLSLFFKAALSIFARRSWKRTTNALLLRAHIFSLSLSQTLSLC